ncbi:MAG TPA: 1-phosphofructokinase family hexose kinase [Phenylobacterium sp.]|nr:1-phosphofructokinase family hexose kinase [Phenylobacterium sp.]
MSPRRRTGPAIATLTLNPALDLSASVDRVDPERKLRCHDLHWDAGGGGVNAARVIRRLGGETLALFPAGGANGARLEALLAAERTPSRVIPIRGETRQDFNAHDLSTGQEFRFVMPGPTLSAAERRSILREVSRLEPAYGVLIASGSLPAGFPVDAYGALARQAKAAGRRFALDASGDALKAGLAAGVWLVKPNLRELEEYCGHPVADEPGRLAACRAIVESGAAQMVALSLSAQGAMLVSADGAWRAAPLDIKPVSTIGAGDSFLAALVWALARGERPDVALQWALATASATLLATGTALARRADVIALRPSVRVESLQAARG